LAAMVPGATCTCANGIQDCNDPGLHLTGTHCSLPALGAVTLVYTIDGLDIGVGIVAASGSAATNDGLADGSALGMTENTFLDTASCTWTCGTGCPDGCGTLYFYNILANQGPTAFSNFTPHANSGNHYVGTREQLKHLGFPWP